MDETMIGVIVGIFAILTICAPIIIFIVLTHSRQFKNMKNRTKAQGRVMKRKYVEATVSVDGSYSGANHYEVTYTFDDRNGNHFVKSFSAVRFPYNEGDDILVYYDAENPNNCVTDHQVKASKEAPIQAVLALLVIAVLSVAVSLVMM